MTAAVYHDRPDAASPVAGAFRSVHRLVPAMLVLLALVIVLLAKGDTLLNDPDTQWHIAVGRWIWAEGRLPATDLYSHTFAGAPWIAKEWVSQLILYAAYQAGGWSGVVEVAAAAIGLSFAILYSWLRQRIRSTAAMALTLAAVVLAAPHFLARPHILVLPVIVLWMTALLSALDRRKPPPLALALLMVLWANMHGSFPLGLVMASVLAGEGVRDAPGGARLAMARQWGAFLLASVAAMMFTPYGWRAVLVPLQMSGNATTLRYILEWQPLAFDLHGSLAVGLLVILSVIMVRRLSSNLFRILATAMLAYLMVRHTRFISLFAMVAPLLAACAIGSCRGLSAEPGIGGFRALCALAGVLLVGAVLVATLGRPEPAAKMTPEHAYRAAQAAGVAGPVYNDYDFGGYLIAHGVKTFIDGRTDQLFLGAFLPDLKNAIADKDDGRFAALLARYGVTWALVRTHGDEARHFATMPEWRRIHDDPVAAVFVADPAR